MWGGLAQTLHYGQRELRNWRSTWLAMPVDLGHRQLSEVSVRILLLEGQGLLDVIAWRLGDVARGLAGHLLDLAGQRRRQHVLRMVPSDRTAISALLGKERVLTAGQVFLRIDDRLERKGGLRGLLIRDSGQQIDEESDLG